jgi:hypothetical protein
MDDFMPCKGIASSTDMDAFKAKIKGDIASHDAELASKDETPVESQQVGPAYGDIDRMGHTETPKQVKVKPRDFVSLGRK